MLPTVLLGLFLSAHALAWGGPSRCEVSLLPAPAPQELQLKLEAKYRTVALLPKFRGEETGIWLDMNGRLVLWSADHFDNVQREAARVILKDGRVYDAKGNPSDASGIFIFVMDRAGNFYRMADLKSGSIHHSAPLAGGPVAGAGEWAEIGGKVFARNRKSGHYDPPVWTDRQVANELIDGGAAEIPSMSGEDRGWGTFIAGDGSAYSRDEIEEMIRRAVAEQGSR
jgi:hypothetical protein